MMRSIPLTRLFVLILGLALLSACQTDSREQLLKTGKSQVALRSIQSRVFDTNEKKKTLRTVIATMQDLGFVVDKADAVLGSVSGTKFDQTTFSLPYRLRMTVTVRQRGDTQLMVRANAQYNITPVEDPEPYQNFFNALSKAMFLEANLIEGGVAAGSFAGKSQVAAETPASATASAASATPAITAASRADFDADRSKIVQAITDYYDMTGYSKDGGGSAQLDKIEDLRLARATNNTIEVEMRYTAIRTYDAEIRRRTSQFTLEKKDSAYKVVGMELLRRH